MNIIRNEVEMSLRDFILSGNGIIIGPPGIGKTYLLKKICSKFRDEKIPYLYLPIDKFDIENSKDLEDLFQYKGDFIEGLSNLPDIQQSKGYIIIDSYDAAKSETSKKFFLNLIERALTELKGKWQVVVSVRIFDAKKSQRLLELFPYVLGGKSSNYQLSEIHCRHFLVPKLTDIELKEALGNIPSISRSSIRSNKELCDLLKIPFNLWLLEQILMSDDSVHEFRKINTQVELLDYFWRKRIQDSTLWEDKQVILKAATQKMVELKQLFVNIESIYQSDKKEAWTALLSDQILVESSKSGQKIAFSHNILFDHAVSNLLLDESEQHFFSFISEDISRQLFLRPSLDFYFTRLWYSNPKQFWKTFWKILRSQEVNLNILLRLTSINVIINEVRKVEELNPIFSQLENGNDQGINATSYILQALEALNVENDEIWLLFLDRTSEYLKNEFVWNFAWTLSKIIDRTKDGNSEILTQCGKIGRTLLTWISSERKRKPSDFIDGVGANWAVPIVAKTFVSDPERSADLLSSVLAIQQEPNFQIMYIYRLVDELESIWPIDPEFAGLVYLSVLSHKETSEETTPMGTPVLPLSSNRHQDYQMCYFSLVKQYPRFLSDDPISATKTAITALNQYIIQNHINPFLKEGCSLSDLGNNFVFNNNEITIYLDHCIAWDTCGYTEEPIKIADELFKFIETRAEQKDSEFIDCLIQIFGENVKVAFFWRRLLITAAKYPDVFAEKLFDLCIAKPILCGSDTIREIGEFIQKSYIFLSCTQRLQIENSILDIPKTLCSDEEEHKYLERNRDRLLARIPKDLLQTEEGIAIRNLMEERKEIPNNEPLIKWGGGFKKFDEEEYLTENGVDLSQGESKALFQSFVTLEEFSTKWLNEKPDAAAIQEILPLLKDVYLRLERQNEIDPRLKNSAWTHLASCVSTISKGINPSDVDISEFCTEVLLKCAKHPEPEYNPVYHSTFNSPAWSPAPRNEAAIGLPNLARNNPEPRILSTIKKLAIDDPVPSVRYLATSRLRSLRKIAPDFVWQVSAEIIDKEQIPVILFATSYNIGQLSLSNEKKAEPFLEQLFQKTISKGKPDPSNPLIAIIVGLAVVRRNEWAITSFNKLMDNPRVYSKHYGYLIFELSKYIDPRKSDKTHKPEFKQKSIEMLQKVVEVAQSSIVTSNRAHIETNDQKFPSNINELYLAIHDVVMRLFFAIEKRPSEVTNTEVRNLYVAVKPLLEKIIEFADDHYSLNFHARTLHYLIQLLDEVTEFDPKFVIHNVGVLVKKGESVGYLMDPLAINEMINFGDKIIADYKDALQNEDTLSDFMVIIDSFVKYGEPKAIQFVWRLDEIYR